MSELGALVLCPRCNLNYYTPYPKDGEEQPSREQIETYGHPASSRPTRRPGMETIWICSDCGLDEAIGAGPIPPSEWPVRQEEER